MMLILAVLMSFISCANDDNDPVGYTKEVDDQIVVLKDTTLLYSLFAETKVMNVGVDKGWWIDEISTDGSTVRPTDEEKNIMTDGGWYEAECEWVSVKRSGSSLEVSVDDNDYEARSFKIVLASVDTAATITGMQEERSAGRWDDVINLTPVNMTFAAVGGTQFSTTNEDYPGWNIVTVTVGEETYVISLEDRELCSGKNIFEKTYEWVSIRRDKEKLYVTTEPNTTGKERTFSIRLSYGDLFVALQGRQLAE